MRLQGKQRAALRRLIRTNGLKLVAATLGFELGTVARYVAGENPSPRNLRSIELAFSELGPDLAAKLSGHDAAANVQLVGELDGRDGEVARASYWTALRTMYIVYTAFAAFGLCVSFFIVQNQLSMKHKEHKTGLQSLRREREVDASAEKQDSS